jgi:hypothetical protein
MVNLVECITDNVNLVEAFFCPATDLSLSKTVITCGWTSVPPIPTKLFHNCTHYNVVEYNYRDLTCIYDISNDSQKVIQRNYIADKTVNNTVYVLAVNEETLPIHRFPNVNTLNDKTSYHKISYKFNNRIFLNIEKDETGHHTLFLRYTHAHNVDMAKMSEDWNTAYNAIVTSIY